MNRRILPPTKREAGAAPFAKAPSEKTLDELAEDMAVGPLGSHRRYHGGVFLADALAADELPREIVGNWCVAIERMLPGKTYTYRRCKDSNWDIIVRWGGFDAQETSCELNTIKRQGAAWLASFGCSGAGLTWLEDDEIRVGKDGWTLEAKIKSVRRVGDPIRYCVTSKC